MAAPAEKLVLFFVVRWWLGVTSFGADVALGGKRAVRAKIFRLFGALVEGVSAVKKNCSMRPTGGRELWRRAGTNLS